MYVCVIQSVKFFELQDLILVLSFPVVDFWSGTSLHDNDFMFHNDTSIDFLVSPKQQKPVRRFLVRKNIPFTVGNIQDVKTISCGLIGTT